jgi:cytochrome c556
MQQTRKLGLGLALACLAWTGLAGLAQEKAATIKDIMGRANKPTGLYFTMARELKEASPDWSDLKKQSKELAELAAALTRTTPPKGDAASWKQQTAAYAANAQALEQAVTKMDRAAAQAAHAKMGGAACMSCHKAHRQ